MNPADHDQPNAATAAPSPDAAALHARLVANLELVEASLEEAYNDVESRIDRLQHREKELENRTRQAALRESKTRLQRKRIAEELRARRAELGVHGTSGGGSSEEVESLKRTQENLQRELRLQRDLADEAMREASVMRDRLSEAGPNDDMIRQMRDELQRLMKERDEARVSLESALAQVNEHSLEDRGRLADELANLEAENSSMVSEIDELRAEISRLNEAAESASAHDDGADFAAGLDWEAQKKLLLENLDESVASKLANELHSLDRATDVATTGMVADPSEVQDLRDQINLLIAAIATYSGENEDGVDYVAALEAEREKLDSLQQQWHDKLRESELELSVERAKLARERVKLEEELREMEAEKNRLPRTTEAEAASEPATRNRWLARLGLSDDDS